jgi:predicted transcriptional regulator
MSILQVTLTDDNSAKLNELARQTGKTPEQLTNEAVEQFTVEADEEEQKKFLAWREAAERIAGMWKGRDDLPDFAELRKTWDRGFAKRD